MTIRRSLGFSALTQLINFLLSFGSVIIVSRLLTPEEIGIFSVSVSLLGFAHILRDFGVGNYLIQVKEVTRANMRAAFSVMLYSSWLIAALLFLARGPIADFYNREGVAEVIGLIAFNFLIVPFGAPILSVLRREMQFGRITIVSTANTLVQVSVTVICAMNGLSYLSMAWGSIAGMATNVILLLIMRPRESILLPTARGLREVLHFGFRSSAASIATEIGNASPDLIFGRTLGFSAVAYFSRAAGLVHMAMGQLMKIVQDVFLPAFARDIRNGENPAALYNRATLHMTGITAPMMAFLAIMAEPLILFLFGEQWTPSTLLATLLCLYVLLFSPFSLAGNALIAAGHVSRIMQIQVAVQCVKVSILLSSLWLPLEQVVRLLALSTFMSAVLHARALKQKFGLSARCLFRALRPSLILVPLTVAAPLALRLTEHLQFIDLSPFLQLATASGLFAATWLIAIYRLRHPLSAELDRLVLHLRKRVSRDPNT